MSKAKLYIRMRLMKLKDRNDSSSSGKALGEGGEEKRRNDNPREAERLDLQCARHGKKYLRDMQEAIANSMQ